MSKNIYLDIDGVLLLNENNLAIGADSFVQYVASRYDVYWLTTHCRGDANVPVKRFGYLFKPETRKFLYSIKATDWNDAKTEAIDFTKPFLWFDDDLFDDERLVLLRQGAMESWVEINLSKNPRQLEQLIRHFPTPKIGNLKE